MENLEARLTAVGRSIYNATDGAAHHFPFGTRLFLIIGLVLLAVFLPAMTGIFYALSGLVGLYIVSETVLKITVHVCNLKTEMKSLEVFQSAITELNKDGALSTDDKAVLAALVQKLNDKAT